MTTPQIGCLLKLSFPEPMLVRLIDIIDEDTCMLFEMRDKKRSLVTPIPMKMAEVCEGLRTGAIVRVEKDEYQPFPYHLVEPEEGEVDEKGSRRKRQGETPAEDPWDLAHRIVSWVLATAGADIFDQDSRRAITIAAEKKFSPHRNEIRRWLNIYWRGGMSRDALAYDYRLVGKNKKPGGKKVGAKGHPSRRGTQVTPEIRQLMRQSVIEQQKDNITIKEKYDNFIRKEFKDGVDYIRSDGTKKIRLMPTSMCPSESVYRYYYYLDRDEVADLAGEVGEIEFAKNHRALTGSSISRTWGPFSRVEVDFSIMSHGVVSRLRRSQILGCPAIGVAYCVWTGAAVGLVVTLSRSSSFQLRLLMENIMSDKVAFCARYGITIEPHEWPMCHVPKLVVCDRGEGKGEVGTQMASAFGFAWRNLPVGRPDLKPTVEGGFAKLTRKTKFLPGWRPVYHVRGEDDADAECMETLYEITQIVIRILLEHNRSINNYRPLSAELIASGTPTSPNELWRRGIELLGCLIEPPGPDELRAKILPRTRVSITSEGIKFKGLEYTHPALEAYFVKARRRGVAKGEISFHPDWNTEIYFWPDPKKSDFLVCTLTEQWQTFKDLSFDEFRLVMQEYRFQGNTHYPVDRQYSANNKQAMLEIHKKARAATLAARKQDGLGKKGYLDKYKAANRGDEAGQDAKDGAHPIIAPTDPASGEPPASNIVPFSPDAAAVPPAQTGQDSAAAIDEDQEAKDFLKNMEQD